MDLQEFLKSKKAEIIKAGFNISDSDWNKYLFNFQKYVLKWLLELGRGAVFADCGLGKTIMQLFWSEMIAKKTNKPVLILAPLAVAAQTINEGNKFDIPIVKFYINYDESTGTILNYEQLKKIDTSVFGGVALDESSILKNFQGQTKKLIIEKFKNIPFKSAWTATPAPNDVIELGNHAEFLGICRSKEMVAQYFINDAFNKDKRESKYRLKKHAKKDFWKWVSSWAMMFSKPSDIGFSDEGYNLPELEIYNIKVPVEKQDNGKLFNDNKVTATEFYKETRRTVKSRCKATADIVNNSKEKFILWIKIDEDEDELLKLIPDAVSVNGKHKPELKIDRLLGFAKDKYRVLITKLKIGQFGLNWQNAFNQIFVSFDFSFEGMYQGIRRMYRFGQLHKVFVGLVITETMGNVLESVKRKEKQDIDMRNEMRLAIQTAKKEIELKEESETIEGKNWKLTHGDSCSEITSWETDSKDMYIFSPPFKDLYVFSDDERDMSNVTNSDIFYQHFSYLLPELLRTLKPGRMCVVHCTQMATTIGGDGFNEIIDFRGELIRLFQKHGFLHHAETIPFYNHVEMQMELSPEVTIFKDAMDIAKRTNNHQLLYGSVKKDSTKARMAFPDYMLVFKKPGENLEPVLPEKNGLSFDYWCKIAQPIWMDIKTNDVLKTKETKSVDAEKHMTPTQREPLKRMIQLYTNIGDEVCSPFNGWGSEGVEAILNDRKYHGVELKRQYFETSINNLRIAEQNKNQLSLF